jgi:polyketide biosynthesis acyl carrier protein
MSMTMNREQILTVVQKHLASAVDGLQQSQIDPMRSMKEYGANSLDIVEVVSASMRELKLKIPRAELSGLKNMNELVDLFYTVAQTPPAPKQ